MLELKFDPQTIQHLGVKMYATLPPALAELISNSYDADAGTVTVEFIERRGAPISITITDDGHGMSLSDIQNKFLKIGRNRRNLEGDVPSPKFGRLPTGKKGLGKLALFGLAKQISIDTIKDGKRNRFHLNWDALLASADTYRPQIDITDKPTSAANRTIIQLNDLKRRSSFDLESIADSLAKIFIVDKSFRIQLKGPNEKSVEVLSSRRYSAIKPEFEWTEVDLVPKTNPYRGKISLHFITALTPIPPSSGLRGIALFSRGKLVNAPEYFSDSTSSHFYQYLTGWIKADFIDLVDEDVISTNRQAINWDHPDMAVFRKELSEIVSAASKDWRKRRADKKQTDFEKTTGINKERWFGTLPEGIRDSVKSIVKSMGENEDVAESFAPVVRALYEIVPEYPLLHWRHLHPSIQEGVLEYYKNKQYGHAADQGTKLYAARIRELTGLDKDGAELAGAFGSANPAIAINDRSTESLRNIQEGHGHLTRGLMAAFRNPMGHAPMGKVVPALITELDCLNVLSLVSYLAGRLDTAVVSQAPKPA
jgi:uncharacterized protein (TIGR02391 family)